MYYHKAIDPQAGSSRWDPRRSRAHFGFAHLLHDSNPTIGNPKALADVAASAIAQAHVVGAVSRDFIDQLLHHCHFAIQDIGYQVDTIEGLAKLVDGGSRNVMVVLGCQTLKMVHARVDAALGVIRRLGAGFDVILAGGNPKPGAAPTSIVNEAREMHVYLDSLLERSPSLGERVNLRLWVEPFSTDTEGNIRQFLDSDVLAAAKPARVFLVSSTFHLMRVSAGLERQRRVLVEKGVRDVVLVGAENPFVEDSIKSLPQYVRSLAFEVYLDVLRAAIPPTPTPVSVTAIESREASG